MASSEQEETPETGSKAFNVYINHWVIPNNIKSRKRFLRGYLSKVFRRTPGNYDIPETLRRVRRNYERKFPWMPNEDRLIVGKTERSFKISLINGSREGKLLIDDNMLLNKKREDWGLYWFMWDAISNPVCSVRRLFEE